MIIGPLADATRTYRVSPVPGQSVFTQYYPVGVLGVVPIQVLWPNPNRLRVVLLRGTGGQIRYGETAIAVTAAGANLSQFPPATEIPYIGALWVNCPVTSGELGIIEVTMVPNDA